MNVNLTNSDKSLHETDPAKTPKPAQPARPAVLTKVDVALLQKTLGQGLSGFARQGDIVELHKRIGEKFENLPAELTALDSENKSHLLDRIKEIETSLNGLEAALRIELPPLLTQTVTQAVQSTVTRRRGHFGQIVLTLLMAVGALALGAWYHEPLLDLVSQLPALLP